MSFRCLISRLSTLIKTIPCYLPGGPNHFLWVPSAGFFPFTTSAWKSGPLKYGLCHLPPPLWRCQTQAAFWEESKKSREVTGEPSISSKFSSLILLGWRRQALWIWKETHLGLGLKTYHVLTPPFPHGCQAKKQRLKVPRGSWQAGV